MVHLYNRSRPESEMTRMDYTPLHIAVQEGHVEKVSQLLSPGANVDQLTKWQETPLNLATSQGTSLEVVKMLVEAGADVNHHDINKFTPLMYACRNGHGSVGCYLVKNGAEVNAGDIYGTTPLLLALSAQSVSLPLISTLLKAKACLNVCNLEGATPLNTIIKSNDNAKWDVLELLLSYPCNYIDGKKRSNGFPPLLTAVRCDDLKSALILIEAGCKTDIKDCDGIVPMSHAIKRKCYTFVELLLAAGERIPREDWMDIKRFLESEDPSMLERLLAVGAECPKLSNMCRRAFYNHYGTQTRNRIDELLLSPLIKMYLTYEIL